MKTNPALDFFGYGLYSKTDGVVFIIQAPSPPLNLYAQLYDECTVPQIPSNSDRRTGKGDLQISSRCFSIVASQEVRKSKRSDG